MWIRWTAPPTSPIRFPIFNVTLAIEQAGEMIAGVVFDPIRQEMFTAERGSGACAEQPTASAFRGEPPR